MYNKKIKKHNKTKKQQKQYYLKLKNIIHTKHKEINFYLDLTIFLKYTKLKKQIIENIHKYKEIIKLICSNKNLQYHYINSNNNIYNLFYLFKNNINNKIVSYNNESINNLKLKIAYLKKHDELSSVYNSYKDVLNKMFKYKNKLLYYSNLEKPTINKLNLQKMINEQNVIMKNIKELNKNIHSLN